MRLAREEVWGWLERGDLRGLLVEELGWDYGGGGDREVEVGGHRYLLEAVAQKRGLVVYQCVAQSEDCFPDHPMRQKIEKAVAKIVREHLIVYISPDQKTQVWQWVKREPGRAERARTHSYHRGQRSELLLQKLARLHFSLEEEEKGLSIVEVAGRVRAAFDVEKVTKQFYERFQKEHRDFLGFIEGVSDAAGREWYASVMLNRLMFIYFIQKKSFLDGDVNYLRTNLAESKNKAGPDRFYHGFLSSLFFEGFAQPPSERSEQTKQQLGEVPYLNGGIFQRHPLEQQSGENIQIPDRAFERLFGFFEQYQWHLEDRPLRKDNEINPDVLGYIFEKYINQKQMGAYYTKEDITGYLGRNTILPFLWGQAQKSCAIAFEPGGGVWRLLAEEPDRYLYPAVRHGITYDLHENIELEAKRELPSKIAVGIKNVGKREDWNQPAPAEYGLPTETWREHVGRRQRYEEIWAKLAAGEVQSISDLVTYNLDLEKLAQDVIYNSEGPELVRAFWKALREVSVLDPTCGSGAFLFAALNLLEPLYTACLDAMRGFVDDLERAQSKVPPPPPAKLEDFREVLRQMEAHASERYFVLKSIIIGNLYGVDLMEEAVEICKLRLFLKLVAQVERKEDIEPLPDIDFNVRSGNTLVGFASLEEVKESLGSDLIKQQNLPQIEARAQQADVAFGKFRQMQVEEEMNAKSYRKAKRDLQARLAALRGELDEYLAGDYGVQTDNKEAYEQWQKSHRPFHWLVEFYGIMRQGGFDVIIGNPPYVEYSKVKKDRKKGYSIQNYTTLPCGDLYAYVLERSRDLSHKGRLGVIVPISFLSTDGFRILRDMFIKSSQTQLFQAFAKRPAKLFSGVEKRLCICLLGDSVEKPKLYLSNYRRWFSEERDVLFDTVRFVDFTDSNLLTNSVFPKIRSEIEHRILAKILKENSLATYYSREKSKFKIYYTRKAGYFVQFFDFIPDVFDGDGNRLNPSELKVLYFDSKSRCDSILAILNSTLFFWFFCVNSDVRNLNRREINLFPCSMEKMSEPNISNLGTLGRALTRDYVTHSKILTGKYKKYGIRRIQTFQPRESKPIIDEIDRVLAKHYGFTDEELDFIINYDIKYRMGLGKCKE